MKDTVRSEEKSLNDSKYEHVLLVDGVRECYYNVDNGNLYVKTIPLIMDYSSNKAKVIFDKAAEKEDWKTLYEHTKFLINLGNTSAWFSFQFIPYDQKYLSRSFAIITAFNPYMSDKDRTLEDNLMANEELSLMLEEGKYYFLSSVGKLSGYREDSYILYDIALKKALEIGKKFQQQSIVYNDGKIVVVVDCETLINVLELNHFEIYKNRKKI